MPFIGPKVREQSGRLIPAGSARQLSGRCGHRPLRAWIRIAGTIHRTPSFVYRGPLHTRPGLCPVHPLHAGEGPSSVRAYALPPSPEGKALRRLLDQLADQLGIGIGVLNGQLGHELGLVAQELGVILSLIHISEPTRH